MNDAADALAAFAAGIAAMVGYLALFPLGLFARMRRWYMQPARSARRKAQP